MLFCRILKILQIHMWLVIWQNMTQCVFCVLCIFVFFFSWSQVVYPYLCFTCFCVFLAFLSSVGEFTFHLVRGFVQLGIFLLCYFQFCHVFYVFSCFSLIFDFNVTARVLCVFVFLSSIGEFTLLVPPSLCFLCFCVFFLGKVFFLKICQ